ncbi:TPR-like protein [Athelia psychrophila]|uniref:TPR-like protein n=1 Tax=Athelia psychrophila TaxID=1759441 RepID=A0A166SFW8_9AGAM|nr:TPR-like protein [Fibularhizoctonia sp. CBS 109695]
MLPGNKPSRKASSEVDVSQRKQVRLQDDPGDRTASTVIQTAKTMSFNTIGTTGTVTIVAGHIIHGDVNMYNADSATALPGSSIVPPPSQPLPPDIWFGREKIVSSLAEVITGNENPRLAILGAGGMGKTATALHLIRHESIVARYGDRVFFVACDATTSTQLLASRILQVIGVSVGAGENLVTAMHIALKCAPPTLLVLDNFESLWEAEKEHTATRDLLQKITDSPSSTLIITMRATIPPPGIRWTSFESLPPLAASSAKEVFLAINATFCDGSDDGDQILDELLRELDYVPLAIHLLAHVSVDLSPRFVLKQWRTKRTRMLSLDSYTKDKLESIDVSISLSMESLDVERNPEAIQLLGMLCLLPDGLLRWQERLEVIEKTFETATSDLLLLRKFALVYTAGGKLGVLSPIRHFVLQKHAPDARHAQCISNITWELVNTYARVDFGPELHAAIEALSPEMGNIGNLIDYAVAYEPREILVDITIQISRHLCYTQPSSYLLKKVAKLVSSVHAQRRAEYCHVFGDILYLQSEYAEAASTFVEARDLFLETEDRLGAAQCSRRLGEILIMQSNYSEATTILTDARSQFLEIGDRLGAARCSRSLGEILRMQNNYSEATAILTDARAEFLDIGNLLGAAQCSRSLGNILRMQSNYSEAAAILVGARAGFLEIGEHLGAAQCSRSLAEILIMQRNYSEATAILTEARAQFVQVVNRLGAAQCSRSLGNIHRMQSDYSEATTILTDARAQFIEIGDRLGATQCSRSLGKILSEQGNYSEATAILTDTRAECLEIGNRLGVAQCSQSLGDILRSQGNHSEATAILTDARAQFLEIGERLGAAQCSQSLGEILNDQSNYSEATAILTDTRAQFIEIGNRLSAAQCSQSLGDILRSQCNYSEATSILAEARSQFLEIGDRLGAAQCLMTLGDNLSDQGNYSEATATLTDAEAHFLAIGERLGAAQCAQSLGEILLIQNKYIDAEKFLMHARNQFLDLSLEDEADYCAKLLEKCTRARDKVTIVATSS